MLRDERLDALMCSAPTDVLLLTGYWPVIGNSVAVFTADGDVAVLVPEDEHDIAAATSDASLVSFAPSRLDAMVTLRDAIREPLASLCRTLSLTQARVGMGLAHSVQPATYAVTARYGSTLRDVLRDECPALNVIAADIPLANLKARKTAVELGRIEATVRVAAEAFAAAPDVIREGRREAEIAASIASAFGQSAAAESIQRSNGFFYCMSGPNSATAGAAYARTRQRRVQTSDLVMIHANTSGDGYWTDITRTWTAGDATGPHLRMREAIMQARQAALDAIRPGVQAATVDRAARRVLETRGFGRQFTHALGHGVGFAAANTDDLPRIHPASPDVLEEGMTFNLEPAIYCPVNGGMRHCDVVAVTRTGVRVLTQF